MNEPYPITDLEQIEAITSTVRGEIVDIVDLMGPVSVSEIAAFMGRPADSLYYHARKLLSVGLLIESGRRKTTKRDEVVYDLPGRPMFVEYRPSQSSFVRLLIRSIAGMLRMAERDFRAAFAKGLVRTSAKGRNIIHSRALGWYTEDEATEIRSRIQEIISEFRSSTRSRKKDSRLYVLTTILVPLEGKRRPEEK